MRLPLQSQSLNPQPSVQSLQSKAFSCNPLVVTLCLPSQALSHNYSVPNFQLQPLTRSLKRSVGTLLSQPFSHNHSVRLVFSLLSPISLQYQAFNLKPSTATLWRQLFGPNPLVTTLQLQPFAFAFIPKPSATNFQWQPFAFSPKHSVVTLQSPALSSKPSVKRLASI